MEEYIKEFGLLTMRKAILEDEEQKIAWYVVGFLSQIEDVVAMLTIRTMDGEHQLA